jgi:hypothetical protein
VPELARAWAAVAGRSTYLPMSGEEVERLLAGLVDRLVTAVTAPRVNEQAARDAAAELVAHHVTGPRSLGRSIQILGNGLPQLDKLQHVDGLDMAVLTVLGALADGVRRGAACAHLRGAGAGQPGAAQGQAGRRAPPAGQ